MKIEPSPKRIIIFTSNVQRLLEFYHRLLGSPKSYLEGDGKWGEIITGKTNIAFHYTKIERPVEINFKLVFYNKDVKKLREELIRNRYKPGKIINSDDLVFCNMKDPDGNVIQFSNRK